MSKVKPRLIGKQVWCVGCIKETPPTIKKADYLIPAREHHYRLLDDDSAIDNRLIGICKVCLVSRNDFQRRNTQPVDVNHKNLVFSNI